jgi:ankyrin repeat protein
MTASIKKYFNFVICIIMVQCLCLSYSEHANAQSESTVSLFIFLAGKNDIPRVKQLVESGININVQNKYGETALIRASQAGHVEMVKYLLTKGANPSIRTFPDPWGGTTSCALDRAKTEEIKKLLRDHGAK